MQAAIEIFKSQSESLREEFSTPKDKRDRSLMREGLALGLSIVKLEKEMLPEAQKATVEKMWNQAGGDKITSEELQSFIGVSLEMYESLGMPQELLETIRRAGDFMRSEEGREATVQFIEEEANNRIIVLTAQQDSLGDLLKLVGIVQREHDPEAIKKLNDERELHEQMLLARRVLYNVKKLMAELKRGSKRY